MFVQGGSRAARGLFRMGTWSAGFIDEVSRLAQLRLVRRSNRPTGCSSGRQLE